MEELQLETGIAKTWFQLEEKGSYAILKVSSECSRHWPETLATPFRRCYIDDLSLDSRARALNISRSEVLEAKLPDEGSTMAGDFGEIIVYVCQAALQHPHVAFGPKKWRLK